jgi:hypothetical protein
MTKYFRRSRAAQYISEVWGLPCATRTLAKLATTGGGPEMQRAGRIPLYTPAACDAWVEAKLSPPVRSTSEYLRREPLSAPGAPSGEVRAHDAEQRTFRTQGNRATVERGAARGGRRQP